jgi:hypothetical protein
MHRSLLGLLLLSLAMPALANDGWVGYGGAPRLMKEGHPTIRMVSEEVWVTVRKERVVVQCDFVFRNEGAATKVRIGFPDYDTDTHIDPKTGPRTTFNWFQAFVDGRRVKTKLELDKDELGWQVKEVAFGRNQVRKLRNRYEVPTGGMNLKSHPDDTYDLVNRFSYVLHTGSSWKGTIGRSDVYVFFAHDAPLPPGPLRLVTDAPAFSDDGEAEAQFWKSNRNGVAARGPSNPVLVGPRTLRFTRKNWRPTKDDDLYLTFGYERRRWSD